jgi:ArsR family transcriptional regulator, virulence genes transcriptional regulator
MSVTGLKKKAQASPQQASEELLARQALEASRVMNALANENRLLILCYLMMNKEMKVGELVDAVRLSQSALSQHLTKLREEGLVEFRRDAQTLHYRIADARVTKIIKLLKTLYCEDIE